MEISKGNSLYSYLKKHKCHFFFYKIREQEGRTNSVWKDWYQWERGGYRERAWGVNVRQILCTNVCKWKIKPIEAIPGMGWGDKEE
jgi:hypothetical protein